MLLEARNARNLRQRERGWEPGVSGQMRVVHDKDRGPSGKHTRPRTAAPRPKRGRTRLVKHGIERNRDSTHPVFGRTCKGSTFTLVPRAAAGEGARGAGSGKRLTTRAFSWERRSSPTGQRPLKLSLYYMVASKTKQPARPSRPGNSTSSSRRYRLGRQCTRFQSLLTTL